MKCAHCGAESEVLETRDGKRRRKCTNQACGHRWTTFEISAQQLHQMQADTIRLVRVRNLINEGRS